MVVHYERTKCNGKFHVIVFYHTFLKKDIPAAFKMREIPSSACGPPM